MLTLINTTDANGAYSFPGLNPGNLYTLTEIQPQGYQSTGADVGSLNSFTNPPTGVAVSSNQIATIPLAPGDAGVNYNFGEVLGTIGDFVWEDLNQNGIQDPGETGIVGVIVTLFDGTGTNVLNTTTTAVVGLMPFSNLLSGTYVVGITNPPAGFRVSPQNVGTLDMGISGKRRQLRLGRSERQRYSEHG